MRYKGRSLGVAWFGLDQKGLFYGVCSHSRQRLAELRRRWPLFGDLSTVQPGAVLQHVSARIRFIMSTFFYAIENKQLKKRILNGMGISDKNGFSVWVLSRFSRYMRGFRPNTGKKRPKKACFVPQGLLNIEKITYLEV